MMKIGILSKENLLNKKGVSMLKIFKKYTRKIYQTICASNYYQKRMNNRSYKKEDPWKNKYNPAHIKRKEWIIGLAKKYGPVGGYKKAIDLGAGEGWITTDLPAEEIYGYDISDIAMSRFPANVKPLHIVNGKFDLIIATGVLYKGYGYKWIIDKINECASSIVLTCHIKELEYGIDGIKGNQVFLKNLII